MENNNYGETGWMERRGRDPKPNLPNEPQVPSDASIQPVHISFIVHHTIIIIIIILILISISACYRVIAVVYAIVSVHN